MRHKRFLFSEPQNAFPALSKRQTETHGPTLTLASSPLPHDAYHTQPMVPHSPGTQTAVHGRRTSPSVSLAPPPTPTPPPSFLCCSRRHISSRRSHKWNQVPSAKEPGPKSPEMESAEDSPRPIPSPSPFSLSVTTVCPSRESRWVKLNRRAVACKRLCFCRLP